jgi:hypothetical protein
MSVVLRTKRSTTSGVIPTDLEMGEMAVNIPDKKIWIGDGTASPALISDYNFTADVYSSGEGVNINTNNNLNLDLFTITRTDTSINKADKLPFLDVSTGTTDLITLQNLLRSGMYLGLSTSLYDGSNDEFFGISLQDNNPNAFRMSTLQNASGVKIDILKIDTEGLNSKVYINGSNVIIAPTEELVIGTITCPLNIQSQQINLSNTLEMNFSVGNGSIGGVTNLVAGGDGNIYITGNLIVSGYLETDVGVRGGTDAELEYLGENMVMDGGTF